MGPLVGRILGAIGLLSAAFYVGLSGFTEAAWGHWIAAASALSVSAWVYLDWEALGRAVGSRGGREQAVSWALVGVVAAISFLTLHLIQRSPVRWDLSEGGVHSLDPQFEAILQQADPAQNLRVLGFFSDSYDAAGDAQLQRFLQLGEAVRAINPKIEWSRINPDFEPLETVKYGVSRSGTVVVVSEQDSAPTGTSSSPQPRTEQLDGVSAQAVANALLRVQQEDTRPIYFVSGHGEASPSEPGELSLTAFASVLETIGYRVAPWSSPGATEVPQDADVLVLAAPQVALQAGEAGLIRDWVDAGGSLFVLLEPELKPTIDPAKGMGETLESWGLAVGNDLVLDPIQSDQGIAVLPLGIPEGAHSIVAAMPKDVPLAFKMAQSVKPTPSGQEAQRIHRLVVSSDEAWGETDLGAAEVTLDPDADNTGPVTFALAASVGSPGTEAEGRVVLVGDVDWLSDSRIAAVANGDFATRVIAFLGAQDDLIQLPPKDRSVTRLELTGLRLPLLILLAVLLVPGAAALTGMIVWGLRRNQ